MTKKASTITKKPAVDPNLENWITGANQNEPLPPAQHEPAGQPASQPASTNLEATAMLSVRIPASLHKALRVHAVSRSLQIQEIITHLVKDYLADEQKAP